MNKMAEEGYSLEQVKQIIDIYREFYKTRRSIDDLRIISNEENEGKVYFEEARGSIEYLLENMKLFPEIFEKEIKAYGEVEKNFAKDVNEFIFSHLENKLFNPYIKRF